MMLSSRIPKLYNLDLKKYNIIRKNEKEIEVLSLKTLNIINYRVNVILSQDNERLIFIGNKKLNHSSFLDSSSF